MNGPITDASWARSDAVGHCILEIIEYTIDNRALMILVALPFDEDDPYECVGGEA